MGPRWIYELGDITLRREVADHYGGARFGGIQPSRTSENVLVYTDPSQGTKHGYNFDGWDPVDDNVFFYTGEGQVGDQDPHAKGNGAILRHLDEGRALRLFEVAGRNVGGGKPQRYMGEFRIDAHDPWRYEEAPDRSGAMRKVVVFRLIAETPEESRAVSQAGDAPAEGEQLHEALGIEPPTPRELRLVVLDWLRKRSNDGLDPLAPEEINDLEVGGGALELIARAGFVSAPPGFGGALSVRTPAEGESAAEWIHDEGLLFVPSAAVGQQLKALRDARDARLPLVWFQGVGAGLWLSVFPLYVVSEDAEGFTLAPDQLYGLLEEALETPAEELVRRYVLAESKRRLHQPIFRAKVLRAYRNRCAVCSLAHPSLLDAAHIVGDGDELGIAAVRNGLALCKLHHAAFDQHYLGITPQLRVEVATRLLDEVDGPTLKHGLQGRHGHRLMIVPEAAGERPDPELLSLHYEQFRAANE